MSVASATNSSIVAGGFANKAAENVVLVVLHASRQTSQLLLFGGLTVGAAVRGEDVLNEIGDRFAGALSLYLQEVFCTLSSFLVCESPLEFVLACYDVRQVS